MHLGTHTLDCIIKSPEQAFVGILVRKIAIAIRGLGKVFSEKENSSYNNNNNYHTHHYSLGGGSYVIFYFYL